MPPAPPSAAVPDPYLPPGPRPDGAWSSAPAPAARPLDGWSVGSLVTGLLGLVPVGLATAVVGLVRTSGGHRRGRGLAVAGLAVSLAVGLVQVVAVAVLVPALPDVVAGVEDALEDAEAREAALADEPVATSPSADVEDADALTVGTCFDEPTTEVFYSVQTVPCDQPHDGEVVALVELRDRGWPGDDPVFDEAYDACLAELTDLLLEAGVDAEGLDPWAYTPTRESWVLYDDRQATCVVLDPDGRPLEGPLLP